MNVHPRRIPALVSALLIMAVLGPVPTAAFDMQEWKELHGKVVTLCREQHYDQALRTAELLVTAADETFGENSPFTGLAMAILAELHHLHGNHELAQELIGQAVVFMDTLLRQGTPNPDRYASDRINSFMSHGDYIPALPYIHWKIHYSRTENGDTHPITAMNTSLLAEIYKLQGRFKESEMLFRQCLSIMESTIGLDRQEAAAIQGSLAELYALQENFEKALPLYEQSYQVMEYTLGRNHPRVVFLMAILADLYRRLGKKDQARGMEARLARVEPPKRPGGRERLEACLKSMRILIAAIDLYNLDHPDDPIRSCELTADKPLFADDGPMTYLQELPRCPSEGRYHFSAESGEVICTKHGSNSKPTIPEDERGEPAVPAEPSEPEAPAAEPLLPDISIPAEIDIDDLEEIAPDSAPPASPEAN